MLKVNNLPRGTTEESLENFFENTRKYGGGDVKHVEYDKTSNSAIITFEEKGAIDKVLNKRPILFNKKVIEVESYTRVAQTEKHDHFTDDLLKTDNKCTIEVTCSNPNTTEDTLTYYFESKRGVNSDVKNIEFVKEKNLFLVTFDEEGAVNKALEKSHVVDGFTLKIKRHSHPIRYPNKTLVKGLNESTSKETLINFFEAKTKVDVQEVQYGTDDSTKAIVTYTKGLDINLLQTTCRKKPLDGNILVVEPVMVADAIIVRGYSDETSESTLEYYFSNKKKSGVEDVSDVKMNREEGFCNITFENPEDVLQACKRQHKVDGRILKVEVFYESLGVPSCNKRPPLKSPPSLTIGQIDRNKISFILNSNLKQEVESTLKSQHAAIITWPDTTEEMVIKIDYTLTDQKINLLTQAQEWEDEWEDDVRNYIGSIGDRLITKHYTVLKDAWDLVVTRLRNENLTSQDDFVLTTDGPPFCTIHVVGYSQSVVKISNKIKVIIDWVLAELTKKRQQMREEVRLKSYQLSLLALSNFPENVRKESDLVEVTMDIQKQTINFTGLSSAINAAKLSMFEITKDIIVAPLGERQDNFIEFVKLPEVDNHIKENIKQADLVGTWEIHRNYITMYAMTDEQAVEAAKIFKESVIETKVMIDNLQMSLIDSQKWKQQVQVLQDEFKERTVATKICTDDQKQIFVFSTSEGEASSIREKIQDFFLMNLEHEQTTSFSPVHLDFMQNQLKTEVEKVEARLKEKNVKMSFTGEGISVEGNQLGLEEAEKEIETLEKMLKEKLGFDNLQQEANKGHDDELVGAQCPLSETRMDKPAYTFETGGQTVMIVKGDITSLDVDVIVNAAKNDLDHAGGLAKALVKKGGHCIQTECSDHIRQHGKLREGEMFCSGSGNLNCQLIIHVVGPVYQNGRNREEERLFDCVQRALIETEKRGFGSIAIPAVCTGIFGYPLDEATRVIVLSVKKYFVDNTLSKVHNVYLCDINDRTVDCFEKAVVDIHSGKKIDDRRVQRFAVPKKKHVDVIVNTTSKDLNLMQGSISSTLAKTAGPSLQRECKRKFPNGIDFGEVAITSAGNLQCKMVCHGALEQWNSSRQVIKIMRKFVINCLDLADKRNLRSIAFPALGTGKLGYPKDVAAQEMYSSIEEFLEKNPRSNINKVFFVLYDQDHQTIKAFEKCERSLLNGDKGRSSEKEYSFVW